MTERLSSSNSALKKRLINNEPFVYAHLIKYERPHLAMPNGKHSTDAKRYAYLTDGPINISFNDGSVNTLGTDNGSQTYIADKILKIGSYSETIEAKATGMSLTLGAHSLNASVTGTDISSTTSTIVTGANLMEAGFRDGDKISVTYNNITRTDAASDANQHEVHVEEVEVLRVGDVLTTIGTDTTAYIIRAILADSGGSSGPGVIGVTQVGDSQKKLAQDVLSGVNITKKVELRVTGLTNSNKTLEVSNIDNTLLALSASQSSNSSLTGSVTIKIISDELRGPLTEQNQITGAEAHKSYHNRDVFIYKAFLNPEDLSVIGIPILVFKGIITSSSIIDNPSKSLEPYESLGRFCTSKWTNHK